MDAFNEVIQVLNAAGVPMLVVGMGLLILAYQRATQAYREGSTHLREENDRLRKRLSEMDGQYFAAVDKITKLLAKSEKAVGELHARKIGLMASQADAEDAGEILTEVKKINNAITDLLSLRERFEDYLKYQVRETHSIVSELAEQVSDNPARLAIISVLISSDAYRKLAAEIEQHPRGLSSDDISKRRIDEPSAPSLLGTGSPENG